MSSNQTSRQLHTPLPTKISTGFKAPGREEKFADFIELTRDISAGITSCMHIIYARDLVNEMNQDAEFDSDTEHIARLNKFWDE